MVPLWAAGRPVSIWAWPRGHPGGPPRAPAPPVGACPSTEGPPLWGCTLAYLSSCASILRSSGLNNFPRGPRACPLSPTVPVLPSSLRAPLLTGALLCIPLSPQVATPNSPALGHLGCCAPALGSGARTNPIRWAPSCPPRLAPLLLSPALLLLSAHVALGISSAACWSCAHAQRTSHSVPGAWAVPGAELAGRCWAQLGPQSSRPSNTSWIRNPPGGAHQQPVPLPGPSRGGASPVLLPAIKSSVHLGTWAPWLAGRSPQVHLGPVTQAPTTSPPGRAGLSHGLCPHWGPSCPTAQLWESLNLLLFSLCYQGLIWPLCATQRPGSLSWQHCAPHPPPTPQSQLDRKPDLLPA